MWLQINAGIAKLSVGRPEDDAVIVPVVSKASADFIEGLVKDAEAKGATLCQPYRREGNLIWPLLIDKARPPSHGPHCRLGPRRLSSFPWSVCSQRSLIPPQATKMI